MIQRQEQTTLVATAARSYYAEIHAPTLPAQTALIDRLIDEAFGRLGARKLELRVCGTHEQVPQPCQNR
ncbi:MAG: hypothetical protein H7Z42_20305 [Roseiflexaceae bacterium]|nr:hypothetical protein [Roseiflexaceae bacterium]